MFKTENRNIKETVWKIILTMVFIVSLCFFIKYEFIDRDRAAKGRKEDEDKETFRGHEIEKDADAINDEFYNEGQYMSKELFNLHQTGKVGDTITYNADCRPMDTTGDENKSYGAVKIKLNDVNMEEYNDELMKVDLSFTLFNINDCECIYSGIGTERDLDIADEGGYVFQDDIIKSKVEVEKDVMYVKAISNYATDETTYILTKEKTSYIWFPPKGSISYTVTEYVKKDIIKDENLAYSNSVGIKKDKKGNYGYSNVGYVFYINR